MRSPRLAALLLAASCAAPASSPSAGAGAAAASAGACTSPPAQNGAAIERAFGKELAEACGRALAAEPPSAKAWALRPPERYDPSALSPREMDDLTRLLQATPRAAPERPRILARLADDYLTFQIAVYRECIAGTFDGGEDLAARRRALRATTELISRLGASARSTCAELRATYPDVVPRTACAQED